MKAVQVIVYRRLQFISSLYSFWTINILSSTVFVYFLNYLSLCTLGCSLYPRCTHSEQLKYCLLNQSTLCLLLYLCTEQTSIAYRLQHATFWTIFYHVPQAALILSNCTVCHILFELFCIMYSWLQVICSLCSFWSTVPYTFWAIFYYVHCTAGFR